LSVGIVLLPGIPLFPLMWVSQALNAVFLPVLLVLMLRLANDTRLMGEYRNKRITNVLAWGTIVLIVAVTLLLFASPLWSSGASS